MYKLNQNWSEKARAVWSRSKSIALETWAITTNALKTDFLVLSRIMVITVLTFVFIMAFVDVKLSKKHHEEQLLVQSEQTVVTELSRTVGLQQAKIDNLVKQVSVLKHKQDTGENTPDETIVRAAGADIRLHKNSGVSVIIVTQANDQQPAKNGD